MNISYIDLTMLSLKIRFIFYVDFQNSFLFLVIWFLGLPSKFSNTPASIIEKTSFFSKLGFP